MFDRSFTAYSWPSAEFPQMRRASDLLCLAVVAALPSAARAGERVLSYAPVAPIAPIVAGDTTFGPPKRIEPPSGRVCFDAVETRDKIAAHRLAEPLRAMRMGRLQGDALRAKLCRWKPDEFVYEIAVLRRDGRLVHVYMNALNGQSVGDPENR